jgi:hypothetical protein
MHIDPKFCHPDDLATLDSFDAVEISVDTIRNADDLGQTFETALDSAQGLVFSGDSNLAYVLIKVIR